MDETPNFLATRPAYAKIATTRMNIKRLIVSILAAFVTLHLTDYLIHGVWLEPTYVATASLWRTDAEMMKHLPFMFLGQFLIAAAFTLIFAACVAEKRCLSCTLKYSASMGVFAGAGQIIMYVVAPYPGLLVAKWFFAGIAQTLLLGVLVHRLYKPLPPANA